MIILKKFNSLLCENGGGFSLGRVAFWLVLAPALKLWWSELDIKENHLYILGFLLIYNSYKKLPALSEFILAIRGIKKENINN